MLHMHTPMLAMCLRPNDMMIGRRLQRCTCCHFLQKFSHFGSKPHMMHAEREPTGLHKSVVATGPNELTEALGSLPKWGLYLRYTCSCFHTVAALGC